MRLPSLPPSRDRRIGLALAAVALAGAVLAASRAAWICDDAFICFRYARNWIEGKGLVFNAGERVEGYTNPLWTAWIALGMKLGVTPERWTIAWGVMGFAGTVATLIAIHRAARKRAGQGGIGVPLGALAAVFHAEIVAYATSGLETSAFTFFALAGLALVAFPGSARRAFGAGLLLGLASITRHDGVLFAAVGAVAMASSGKRTIRHTLALAAGFTIVFAPVTFARVAYYGGFFPNTYYAKSGGLAWWSQGLRYLALYLQRYWVVAVGLAAWIAAAARLARGDDARREAFVRPGIVLVAGGLVYAIYITRVGGDFMFARLLLPATPPLLAAVDLAVLALAPRLETAGIAAAAYLGALALTPSPFNGPALRLIDGIADEHAFYSPAEVDLEERRAAAVAPFFANLPVRVAFYGSEARFVYRTRIPVAVEGHAGLTDAVVARRPLPLNGRGRVGHEKLAPASYLLGDRKIHFVFSRVPTDDLRLDEVIPRVRVRFGDVVARVLTWDPELYAELRRRGAVIPDFPKLLDDYIATALPSAPKAEVEANYLMTGRFYFTLVDDPAREDPFRKKLGLPLRSK